MTMIDQLRRAQSLIKPKPKIICRNKEEAQRAILIAAIKMPVSETVPLSGFDAFEWVESEHVPHGQLYGIQEPSEAEKFDRMMRSIRFEPQFNAWATQGEK